MNSDVFLNQVVDIIRHHSSDQQLAFAVNAHRLYLEWQKSQTKELWFKFLAAWKLAVPEDEVG